MRSLALMHALALALTLVACSPSAQLLDVCTAWDAHCVFASLPRMGEYDVSTGLIRIDRSRCDANWPLCAWVLLHEVGHQKGFTSEHDANCFALARASMPARRAAEALLGQGWETECVP